MRLVKPSTIEQWARKYPTASSSLAGWLRLIKAARFKDFASLSGVFRSADEVKVKSGRKVIIFNISGNNFRLIAAVHFNTQTVFALRFMTHAEYSKDRWKGTL